MVAVGGADDHADADGGADVTKVTCHCGARLHAVVERWGPETKGRERVLVGVVLPTHPEKMMTKTWISINDEQYMRMADQRVVCRYSLAEIALP